MLWPSQETAQHNKKNQNEKMKATIEETEHLTLDEKNAVSIIAKTIEHQTKTLTDAKLWMQVLKGWFIYQGGNHLALHKASGDPRRIMLVTI